MKMITKKIEKLVQDTCRKETNQFGFRAWSHHIASVVKYTKLLAKKLGADQEITEIAALLHDYASVSNKDWYENHHIHGARLAEGVLKQYDYPPEKIEKVKHCIFAHRGSKKIKRETIESEIVASADSMSHFDNIPALLELAYTVKKMKTDEGAEWVLNKIERSWKKLMPEAKKMMRKKYEAIKMVLGKNNNDY
ncbi:HD domain-containing protein [Patescibacteria group bacterium]|nr:MAG: HD domain-containing protein [Patescibacteria group bacterium]